MDRMSLFDSIRHRLVEDGDCLRWTGGCCSGHPAMRIDGKTTLLRRAIYVEAHGRPIPAGKILRPTCGMTRCLNREHWKLTTYKAVAIECGALGLMSGHLRSARIAAVKRAGPQAKITDAQAAAIFVSDEPGAVLAARHGICAGTVSKIRLGQCRRNFASPRAGLVA